MFFKTKRYHAPLLGLVSLGCGLPAAARADMLSHDRLRAYVARMDTTNQSFDDLDTSRAKGVSRWWPGAGHTPSSFAPDDAAWLHVSAGLGTSPYAPVRFACRPEATLLTLTSR